jgi:YfiH family protein
VSEGIYASLNGGFGSKDNRELVEENRKLAATALGGGDDTICGLHQIHSNICHEATADRQGRPEGDAITAGDGFTCVVLTADCAPVLLADSSAQIVGAAHAGWRGAVAGIIPATVNQLVKMGATLAGLRAVVGPAIQQASYQVGDDLRDTVLAASPDAEVFFTPDGTRFRFDLPSYVLDQLQELGVTAAKIDADTYSDDRFYSHRRAVHNNTPDAGRLMSMIRLRQDADN